MKKNEQYELENLLDKNEYRVVVRATDGCCMASFPRRTESPILSFHSLYQEFTDVGVRICECDENGEELVSEEIECPVYAQYVFTVYQILFNCMYIDYSASLIKFMIKEDEVDEKEFLKFYNNNLFIDDENIGRENKLVQLLSDCLANGFQPLHTIEAENANILDGFITIRNIFMPNKTEEENNE